MKPAISPASPLILASTSKYRAELLKRLAVPFEAVAPGTDETPRPGETPANLAQRLARAKAQDVAARHAGRWVLGSDQVPSFDGRVLEQPGNREAGLAQLLACSGKSVVFFTAVALIAGDRALELLDTTIVRFRPLTAAEAERYLDLEPAYDCAGTFKVEGLGISLFEAVETRDPTALIGLPLIAVRRLLAEAGYPLP
ncbi:MAG: Maf family protein [Gammaproteobacteria bacterium]